MTSSCFHDPLALNLRRQTRALLSAIPTSSQYAIDIQNASSTTQLLPILSRLLTEPAFTLTIASLYRPILYDLCARWLQDYTNTEEQLIALCLLIEIHEELFPYVLFHLVLYLLTTSLESCTVYCRRPFSKRARLVL
jgi:midasin